MGIVKNREAALEDALDAFREKFVYDEIDEKIMAEPQFRKLLDIRLMEEGVAPAEEVHELLDLFEYGDTSDAGDRALAEEDIRKRFPDGSRTI